LSELVEAHHERFDGKGYPRGLRGVEIPLGARILAVADAYDAMAHDRRYRTAFPRDSIIRQIELNLYKQFDPDVGSAALNLIREEQINPLLNAGMRGVAPLRPY
jgi:HD-GYP domain-containing protein (c-di-GMP phosphodiesterase class II)